MATVGQIVLGIAVIGGMYAISSVWLRIMESYEQIRELDREIAADELRTAQLAKMAENARQAERSQM